jgi:thiosulfate reductase cytochrome b subunit
MSNKLFLYPSWIRIWHGINGLLCLMLIFTGISMQYSNVSSLLFQLKTAVKIHNICGITLALNYLFYFISNIISGNIRFYKINPFKDMPAVIKQIKYYSFGIFKGESEPFEINEDRKFNPLQRYIYVKMMYIIIPLIIFTGIGLLIPDILINNVLGKGGFILAIFTHTIIGFFISIFMIIHFYFAFLSKSLSSIITGWHKIGNHH